MRKIPTPPRVGSRRCGGRGRDVFTRVKNLPGGFSFAGESAGQPLEVRHSNFSRIARPTRAGDVSFKFLPYQLSMVR